MKYRLFYCLAVILCVYCVLLYRIVSYRISLNISEWWDNLNFYDFAAFKHLFIVYLLLLIVDKKPGFPGFQDFQTFNFPLYILLYLNKLSTQAKYKTFLSFILIIIRTTWVSSTSLWKNLRSVVFHFLILNKFFTSLD